MTPGDDPSQAIARVLDTLRQSRALLLDPCPGNIDRCRAAIAHCVPTVANLAQTDRGRLNIGETRDGLLLVRRELGAIAGLLDSAAVFRRGMLKAISDATRPKVAEVETPAQKVRHVHVLC
jgi:hypothetical protein